jgi:hypothetical protein
VVSFKSGDGDAAGGSDRVTSVRAGGRSDGTRQRLADALRANLRRRKTQQREQNRHQAARVHELTTVETSRPEAMSSQPLLPIE